MFSRTNKTSGAIAYLLSLPCEMYCTATHLFFRINQTYLHYHVKACCTATTMSSKDVLDNPSQPCENLLYINDQSHQYIDLYPSQPCENLLYINLNQWHYRLLRNFNLATNDKDVIPIHLYFRL